MSEKRELSKRESQCLIELYMLISKYRLSIRYTRDDDGVHFTIDGLTEGNELSPEPAYTGFLSSHTDLSEFQKTIEQYLTQYEHLKKLSDEHTLKLVELGAMIETCDLGHKFVKLPSHPMRYGKPRCPNCMSLGLNRYRGENAD